jgi:hypothetical protein
MAYMFFLHGMISFILKHCEACSLQRSKAWPEALRIHFHVHYESVESSGNRLPKNKMNAFFKTLVPCLTFVWDVRASSK